MPAPTKQGPSFEPSRDALGYLMQAWEEALAEGVPNQSLAYSALFVALSDLVTVYGESAVGDLMDSLGSKVRVGAFTQYQSRQ